METITKIAMTLAFGLFVAILLDLLWSIPVYFLWNWLMPELFGIKTITFFQAMGLTVMLSLLFKSPSPTKSK